MAKIKAIYERWNPNREDVAFVAIQTQTEPPYVWRAYGRGETLPQGSGSMALLPIEAARNLFDFKEGKLADLSVGKATKITRVYQHLGTVDETDLPQGTRRFRFTITKAKIRARVSDLFQPRLTLGLREEGGYVTGFNLSGKTLIDQFFREAKASETKELTGKDVFGFVTSGKDGVQGLALEQVNQ